MDDRNDYNSLAYDSTKDTMDHISRVRGLLRDAANELIDRGDIHDRSKLLPPEKEHFDRETPLLEGLEFNSKAYSDSVKRLKPALDHHYANNSHHPQYYGEQGMDGMNLFDLIECFFDWKASGERTKGGNIYKSIDINKGRKKINMSEQVAKIFVNTAKYLGYEELGSEDPGVL